MKPYVELDSAFIRNAIRDGSFADVLYRQYVNTLVGNEHITLTDRRSQASGIARLGTETLYYQCAAKYPVAFDHIRREFDAETRADFRWRWIGGENADARCRWAHRHREEWNAVRWSDESASPAAYSVADWPPFAPLRFLHRSYQDVAAIFIRAKIQQRPFDDRTWRLAAHYPTEFDRIQAELGAPTRASLMPAVGGHATDEERDVYTQEYAEQWCRVQEAADDVNTESLRHARSVQRDDA